MPGEYHKAEVSITQVLKKAWEIVEKTADERTRLQALALIRECNSHNLDMITNGTITADSLKYVKGKAKRPSLAADKKRLEDISEDVTSDDDIDIGKTNNDIF
jgi:predicted subunit of tRNA(5-methylaminomethyl-2-thiouridylate) methyltransferase